MTSIPSMSGRRSIATSLPPRDRSQLIEDAASRSAPVRARAGTSSVAKPASSTR
jgi:hypothetical protein